MRGYTVAFALLGVFLLQGLLSSAQMDSFNDIAYPSSVRESGAATVSDVLYLFGGNGGTQDISTGYKFSLSPSRDWVPIASLPTAVSGVAACVKDQTIYTFGGVGGVNDSYVYDVTANSWSTVTRTGSPVGFPYGSCVWVSNKFHIFGGDKLGSSQSHYSYDPVSQNFTQEMDIPAAVDRSSAVLFNNKIYIFGAANNTASYVQIYNVGSNEFEAALTVPGEALSGASMVFHTGGASSHSLVVAAGSKKVTGTPNTDIYTFNLESSTWNSWLNVDSVVSGAVGITRTTLHFVGGRGGTSLASPTHRIIPLCSISNVNTTCDDGTQCTTNDMCQSDGTCSGTTGAPCVRGICEQGSCNTRTGACEYANKLNGVSCNPDNDKCADNICTDGACVTGRKLCTSSDPCQISGCNMATGNCTLTPANSGACDDGLSCTTNDVCSNGVCAGTSNCPNSNMGCRIGVCLPNSTCSFTNAATNSTCSDGNNCSKNDRCVAGSCTPGPLCSRVCHVASCGASEAAPCTFTPMTDGVTCNDGDACTSNDKCMSGTCVGTPICGETSVTNDNTGTGAGTDTNTDNTPDDNRSADESSEDKKGTVIAAILIPVAVIIFCAVLVIMELVRRKKENRSSEEDGRRVEMVAVKAGKLEEPKAKAKEAAAPAKQETKKKESSDEEEDETSEGSEESEETEESDESSDEEEESESEDETSDSSEK